MNVASRLCSLLVPGEVLTGLQRRHLIVVPTGCLHDLPFETLLNGEGRFLVEDYDITYTPSLMTLATLRDRSPDRGKGTGVVAFGDASFKDRSLAPLPSSREEVRCLVSVFGPDNVRLFTGDSATESNFKAYDFSQTRVLHIATHGVLNDRRPSRSALLLAGEDENPQQGLLQALEIARLEIPVDLVFLAACRTGQGLAYPGEGILSLAQPFMVAGCNSVIVSHWGIDDRSSVGLVDRFYKSLHNGSSKAESLSAAKRAMIQGEEAPYSHPYYWAAYTLIGLPQ